MRIQRMDGRLERHERELRGAIEVRGNAPQVQVLFDFIADCEKDYVKAVDNLIFEDIAHEVIERVEVGSTMTIRRVHDTLALGRAYLNQERQDTTDRKNAKLPGRSRTR